MQREIEFIQRYWFSYIQGMGTTILLSLIGVVFGTILGLLICSLNMSKNKVLHKIGKIYIEIIRGTPLMAQLLIIFFGLKIVIPESNEFLRNSIFLCSIAICMNAAAYIAELIRGGIVAVDKGQVEAGRCLGLSEKQVMNKIVLPQAIKTILPSLGNEFIALIKETAIVTTVGVPDLIYKGTAIKAATYRPIAPIIYAAICYFIMTYSLSKLMNRLERRMAND